MFNFVRNCYKLSSKGVVTLYAATCSEGEFKFLISLPILVVILFNFRHASEYVVIC